MPATSLQQLKIPRGYRGDWPLQEYALIDAVEATINEIEEARGSNTSLAAELEETYATKSYVQLAIADPNVNDIYVSDLAVKLSESGLVGYTLQVQPGNTLAFTNTYTLGNGTLANPSIKFNTSVSGGLFMSQDVSHETMSVKVNGGVALDIVHDKVSGANRLELGNFVAYSDGDIEGTDATLRAITSTGTGAYATNLAEAIIGEATIGTLNITSLDTPTITTTDISFSYFGTILVLDAQNLNTLPEKSLYARTTNTCTNTPEVSAGYLNHYWSGAGQSRQTWVSSTTGYLYERVNNGAWTKYAKAGGDSSQTFEVATATSDTHAVTKLTFDDAVSALAQSISDEAGDRAAADTALAELGGSNTQRFKIADAVDNDEAVSKGQLDTKAPTAGNAAQEFAVAPATTGNSAVNKTQLEAFLPSGVVVPFSGSAVPIGWLECNGSAVSRTTYANLFAAIGTLWGIGDGSTTFNLPETRGEFIRGYDNGRGIDSGRAFASSQTDDIKAHTHSVTGYAGVNASTERINAGVMSGESGNSTGSTGGTETRPRNVSMMYIIKT